MQSLDLKDALAWVLGNVSALGRVFPSFQLKPGSCREPEDGGGVGSRGRRGRFLRGSADEKSVLCAPPAPPADASFGPVNCEASRIAMATGTGLEPPEDGKRRHSGGFSRSGTTRHTH